MCFYILRGRKGQAKSASKPATQLGVEPTAEECQAPVIQVQDSPSSKAVADGKSSPTESFVENVEQEMRADTLPDRQPDRMTSTELMPNTFGYPETQAITSPAAPVAEDLELFDPFATPQRPLTNEAIHDDPGATPLVSAEGSAETKEDENQPAQHEDTVQPTQHEDTLQPPPSPTLSAASGWESIWSNSAISSFASTASTAASRSEVNTLASGAASMVAAPLCVKCCFPTDAMTAIMRVKASASSHAKWICRACNSITTMLNRNVVQQGNLKLKGWTEEQLKNFFDDAKENGFQDGRANWSLIRDCLKRQMIKRVTESTSRTVLSEYKPLDVWENLGYDVQMISAYNVTEWNPACGMCYACPIKSLKWEHVEMDIEEEILTAESAYKGKKKPAAGVEEEGESGGEATPNKSKRKRAESQSAKDAKEQEKLAKKAATETKAFNNKMQILASRAMSTLSQGAATLKSISTGKSWAKLPNFMQDKFKADLNLATEYLAEAESVIKNVKRCSKDNTRLPELTFDATGLGILGKSLRKNVADYDAFEKLLKSA